MQVVNEGCKQLVSYFSFIVSKQIKSTIHHVFYGLVYLEIKSYAFCTLPTIAYISSIIYLKFRSMQDKTLSCMNFDIPSKER